MKLGTKLALSVLAGSSFSSLAAGLTRLYLDNSLSGALIEVVAVCCVSLLFSLVAIIIFGRPTINSFKMFSRAIDQVTKGNLDVKLEVKSQDEIGQLAESFNAMIEKLRSERENIEKKVSERTADLEKINKFMVGREIKMIDLKKQISELTKNQCRRE